MPTWRGDGVRGGGVVAGEHPHLERRAPRSWATASADSGLTVSATDDQAGERAVDGDVHRRLARRPPRASASACERGDVDAVRGHQRARCRPARPAVDVGVDAVAGDGVEDSQRRRVPRPALAGRGDDRLADRVLAADLGGGDQGEQLVLRPSRRR